MLHAYFAYGSNLCVTQMAQRCPGAADPGPPRSGYLERILAGAVHHELPHRWVEFLRRWDPAHWPQRPASPDSAAPQSLSELLGHPASPNPAGCDPASVSWRSTAAVSSRRPMWSLYAPPTPRTRRGTWCAIPLELRGQHPDNPVDRANGVQLELPSRVRGLSPRSPLPRSDGLSPVTSVLIDGLAAAARSWASR